jgi:hypothetical protein
LYNYNNVINIAASSLAANRLRDHSVAARS